MSAAPVIALCCTLLSSRRPLPDWAAERGHLIRKPTTGPSRSDSHLPLAHRALRALEPDVDQARLLIGIGPEHWTADAGVFVDARDGKGTAQVPMETLRSST
jgi:hypothetical protein